MPLMTVVVAKISPGHSMKDCMENMIHKRVRRLPVAEGKQLVDLISIGDVVKSIISDQEFMIQQLENYIAGRV